MSNPYQLYGTVCLFGVNTVGYLLADSHLATLRLYTNGTTQSLCSQRE
jgi:hypothetical protein